MLHITVVTFLLSILPSFVLSLQCYNCQERIQLNYLVTSETVPSISTQCELVNSSICSVDVIWDLKTNTSAISVSTEALKGRDVVPNRLGVYLLLDIRSNNITNDWQHVFYYDGNLIEKGNDEVNLKKLLRSLSIEERFQQEIVPLIQVIPSFDPKTANCSEFRQHDFECPRRDLTTCSRCFAFVNQTATEEKVCATCPYESEPLNSAVRYKTFFSTNLTVDADATFLTCQQHGCNSVENVNRVKQAGKITFNLFI